jgi:hypothetical protein
MTRGEGYLHEYAVFARERQTRRKNEPLYLTHFITDVHRLRRRRNSMIQP